jgi:hypothetical protein
MKSSARCRHAALRGLRQCLNMIKYFYHEGFKEQKHFYHEGREGHEGLAE